MYIIRVGTAVGAVEGYEEISKIRELQNYLKDIGKSKNNLSFITDWRVSNDKGKERVKEIDLALELFKHGKKVFEEVSIEDAWDYTEEGKKACSNVSFGYVAGIHSFITGSYYKYNPVAEATFARFKELV